MTSRTYPGRPHQHRQLGALMRRAKAPSPSTGDSIREHLTVVVVQGTRASRTVRRSITIWNTLTPLSIFLGRPVAFSHPTNWPDPYEHWWCRAIFGRPGPLQHASAYVLCWSRSQYDEPAWRMAGSSEPTRSSEFAAGCATSWLQPAPRGRRSGSFFAAKWAMSEKRPSRRANSVQTGEIKEVTRAAANLLTAQAQRIFASRGRYAPCGWTASRQNTALFLPIDAKTVVKQVMCSPYAHPDQRARIRQEFDERFAVQVLDAKNSADLRWLLSQGPPRPISQPVMCVRIIIEWPTSRYPQDTYNARASVSDSLVSSRIVCNRRLRAMLSSSRTILRPTPITSRVRSDPQALDFRRCGDRTVSAPHLLADRRALQR